MNFSLPLPSFPLPFPSLFPLFPFPSLPLPLPLPLPSPPYLVRDVWMHDPVEEGLELGVVLGEDGGGGQLGDDNLVRLIQVLRLEYFLLLEIYCILQ